MDLQERIDKALQIAEECGMYDGDHHKMWVIDQMVRALTDCPTITKTATDYKGQPYSYETYGESNLYNDFRGDTGYWDVGIPP